MTITKYNVERDVDVIYFNNLSSPKSISDFIKCIKAGIQAGEKNFTLDFRKVNSVFPNTATPLAGLINYYVDKHGVSFDFDNYGSVNVTKLLSPLELPKNQNELSRSLGKVWKFSFSDEIDEIHKAMISELRKTVRFGEGVLEGIEWSIYEIMDNVLLHSEYSCGYIMGQLHPTSKHVAFTIYDTGQGIYNSLKNSPHRPRMAVDALTMCVKEGVTRDKKLGQGNGMTGLFNLIQEGNGSICITSGNGYFRHSNGEPYTKDVLPYPSNENQCTTVDFQLDYSNDISLDKVLTFQGKTFPFTNLHIENLEDDRGDLVYKLSEHAEGTGTRESAIRVKNEIVNLFNQSKKNIVLDFDGISISSSSFADELIAKLIIELGLFQFNNIVKLRNMNVSQQQILQRSVVQRLIEEYSKPTVSRKTIK